MVAVSKDMIETSPQNRHLGYARVSTYGQTLDAQLHQFRAEGCAKVYREKASGAQTNCAQLVRVLAQLAKGDVLTVTRLDRLPRSTRDLLNMLAAVTGKGAGFRSLNVMGGHDDRARALDVDRARWACRVRAGIDPRPHGRRPRTRQGKGREDEPTPEAHRPPEARGDQAPRSWRGDACGDRTQLQRVRLDDFEADDMQSR
jgi:Resolvase, N terminal domain